MEKWEYKVEWQSYDGVFSKSHFAPLKPSVEAGMNDLGGQGWEVCGVSPTGERFAGILVYFKRPKD